MVSFQKPLCMGLNTTVLHLDTFCLMVSAWNVSRISPNRKLALDESNRWETAEAWAPETVGVRKHSSVTGIAAVILECGHQELYMARLDLSFVLVTVGSHPASPSLWLMTKCCSWDIFPKCLISKGLLCVRSQYLRFQKDIGRWGLTLQRSRASTEQRYRTIIETGGCIGYQQRLNAPSALLTESADLLKSHTDPSLHPTRGGDVNWTLEARNSYGLSEIFWWLEETFHFILAQTDNNDLGRFVF